MWITEPGSSWPQPAPLEFFGFPGGEWSIRRTGDLDTTQDLVVDVRGSGTDDLVRAGIAASFARHAGMRTVLLLPYLPAARSDHDEVMGAEVYARLVNGFAFDHVVAIDPHSSFSAGLYDHLTIADHTPFVTAAARTWQDRTDAVSGVIAADKSGSLHAASIATALGVPMFQALKHRDPATGGLTGFSVEPLPASGQLLVVDDICDGGGTFLGLAGVAGIPKERLGLWVTHGIFSGRAATTLPEAFSFIASTDSVPSTADFTHFDVERQPLLTSLLAAIADHDSLKKD